MDGDEVICLSNWWVPVPGNRRPLETCKTCIYRNRVNRVEQVQYNVEQCVYLGKVQRRQCECPKDWERDCEIHGTTTLRKCLVCSQHEVW